MRAVCDRATADELASADPGAEVLLSAPRGATPSSRPGSNHRLRRVRGKVIRCGVRAAFGNLGWPRRRLRSERECPARTIRQLLAQQRLCSRTHGLPSLIGRGARRAAIVLALAGRTGASQLDLCFSRGDSVEGEHVE